MSLQKRYCCCHLNKVVKHLKQGYIFLYLVNYQSIQGMINTIQFSSSLWGRWQGQGAREGATGVDLATWVLGSVASLPQVCHWGGVAGHHAGLHAREEVCPRV